MHGYFGKVIDVDLSAETVRTADLAEDDAAAYIGGSGLAARYLFEGTGPGTGPLSPDNLLIFSVGPFTGTSIPSSGRHAAVARSPLTGVWGESDAGGRWGTRFKRAGVDALIIRGAAKRPVCLVIDESGARITDAADLWGRDAFATADALKETYGKKTEAAVIGPAGEKQVLLASIMHDGRHGRAAGRCGLGAVMGSKRLKAVVVSGNKKVPVARPEALKDQVGDMLRRIKAASASLRKHGTAGGLARRLASGDMPVKNFSRGEWAGVDKVSGETLSDTYLKGRFACGGCPIACGREIKMRAGRHGAVDGAGPEYESVASLGSYCLVDDLEAVCAANDLCNRYGMDAISAGAAVAFGMEAFEKGLITAKDLDGASLQWGDAGAMVEMVRMIGEQKGFGKVLGRGVKKASEALGLSAGEFAVHVKGLELPAHDPRAYVSSGVSYATSNRGGCHLAGFTHGMESGLAIPELGYPRPLDRFASRGKGTMAAKMQNLMGMFDALKICKFLLYSGITVTDLVACLNLVTGRDADLEEFMTAGERIFTLKRLFNLRCGLGRSDDALPPRILTPLAEGGTRGQVPKLDEMLDEYYAFRGWDADGVPRPEELEALGLTWAAP